MFSILIVDDDPNVRTYLGLLIGGSGYAAAAAADGREALDLLRVHRPHAVLLDLQMPVMDG